MNLIGEDIMKQNSRNCEYFIVGLISISIIDVLLRIFNLPSIWADVEYLHTLSYNIFRNEINYFIIIMLILSPFSLIWMGRIVYNLFLNKIANMIRTNKYYKSVKKVISELIANIKNTKGYNPKIKVICKKIKENIAKLKNKIKDSDIIKWLKAFWTEKIEKYCYLMGLGQLLFIFVFYIGIFIIPLDYYFRMLDVLVNMDKNTLTQYLSTAVSSIAAVSGIVITITAIIIQHVSAERGYVLMEIFFKDKRFWSYLVLNTVTIIAFILSFLFVPPDALKSTVLVILTIMMILCFFMLIPYMLRVLTI
jgi:hypothetical protein